MPTSARGRQLDTAYPVVDQFLGGRPYHGVLTRAGCLPRPACERVDWALWAKRSSAAGCRKGEEWMIKYQELISSAAQRINIELADARAAADATIEALARSATQENRRRLSEAVPGLLRPADKDTQASVRDAQGFVQTVASLTQRPAEQARYRAQAVLAALAESEPELVDALALPDDIKALATDPPVGGGIVGPEGGPAPLTPDEVAAALVHFPDWSGGTSGLRRSISLPPDRLDQVLAHVARVDPKSGRGPDIHRESDDTAVLVVRTQSVKAVTALDIELISRIDTAIREAPVDAG
jgi:pterin-4a-carbinolamine dehydratase